MFVRRGFINLFITLMSICSPVCADEALLFGTRLDDLLQTRRSLSISETPVREVCRELQRNTQIAIIVDRRLDPSARITVQTDYVTTREVVAFICHEIGSASASFTDFGVVIGPTKATARLRTLIALNRAHVQSQRRKLDDEIFEGLVQPRELSWDDLSTPRDLIREQAEAIGLSVLNLERIPHDLWSGVRLPRIAFSDFATLVLAQFNLSFEFDRTGGLVVVDVPSVVEIEQRHRFAARAKPEIEERIGEKFGELEAAWTRSSVTVSATIEVHEQIERLIRGDNQSEMVNPVRLADRRMTFKVPPGTPLGAVVASFRSQGIPILIEGKSDAELEPLLQENVEFDVKAVPAEEFFRLIFKSWNASVDVRDQQVVIRFRKE